MNYKRPGNLARLASATVNLANLTSAHSQLVKQKDIVAVLCLLSANPRLVEVRIQGTQGPPALLPQVRANREQGESRRCATVFACQYTVGF